MFWIIVSVACVGFFVMKSARPTKREVEKEVYRDLIDRVVGSSAGDLVLCAAIPLKQGATISDAYADSLGRHFKLYLSHNPEEAKRFIEALDGEKPQDALSFELILERDQHLRTIILRAVALIMSKKDWEFGSAIDLARLKRLLSSLERHPGSFHLDDGENNTLRQAEL